MTARERIIQSYVRLIASERILMDDVPEKFYNDVLQMYKQNGGD